MAIEIVQRLLLLAGFASLMMSVHAQADSYSTPPLRVMPADAVVNVPSPRQPPYRLGDEFFLVRENKLPSAAAEDLAQTGFEVRLFRIDSARVSPKPWLHDQDQCDIFLSLVFKHLKFRGDRVDLGPLSDNHWLTQTSEGYFGPGHFLVVIEQDSPPDTASEVNHWEVFRLATALRDEYFKQGVRIEIDPEPRGGPPVSSPDEDTRIKQALDMIARTIASKFNCYQVKPIPTTTNGEAQIALASCIANPLPFPG